MTRAEAIKAADSYRGYSRAIRIVSNSKSEDLTKTSHIVSYLYEQGHKDWIKLVALPIDIFAYAFDCSRAKGGRP